MEFLIDVAESGLPPISIIFARYRSGNLSRSSFDRALRGRQTRDHADSLPDDDPQIERLSDFASDVEEGFLAEFDRAMASKR